MAFANERKKSYFPLGSPYFSYENRDVYVTDISLASLVLPFGVAGGVIFLWFFRNLLQLIAEARPQVSMVCYTWSLAMVVAIGLVSFNVDLITRSTAAILLAAYVVSLKGTAEASYLVTTPGMRVTGT